MLGCRAWRCCGDTDTRAQGYEGTQGTRHRGTRAQGYEGTRHRGTRVTEESSSHPQWVTVGRGAGIAARPAPTRRGQGQDKGTRRVKVGLTGITLRTQKCSR